MDKALSFTYYIERTSEIVNGSLLVHWYVNMLLPVAPCFELEANASGEDKESGWSTL